MPAQTRTPHQTDKPRVRGRAPGPHSPDTRPRRSPAAATRPTTRSAIRWKWVVFALFVLVFVSILALLRASFFAVHTVQISGEARTTEGAILEALAVGQTQALATYDTEAGREAVGALPWVGQVEVTRRWPSTLSVTVRERAPVAAIARPSGTEWLVVGADGRVLERRLTPPNGVVLIAAPVDWVTGAKVGSVMTGVEGVLAASLNLPLQLAPWIDSWSVDSTGAVSAELVGSATADFGTEADHRIQYVSLASILDGGISLVCIKTIDLSISDTPVIVRDPDCLLASSDL